jgi:hypothetical protein
MHVQVWYGTGIERLYVSRFTRNCISRPAYFFLWRSFIFRVSSFGHLSPSRITSRAAQAFRFTLFFITDETHDSTKHNLFTATKTACETSKLLHALLQINHEIDHRCYAFQRHLRCGLRLCSRDSQERVPDVVGLVGFVVVSVCHRWQTNSGRQDLG